MLHLLTCVLVVLKAMELIHWSWFLVFLPSICAIVIPLVLLMITMVLGLVASCQ